MKQFKFIVLMLAMIASMGLFTSCGSDDEEEQAPQNYGITASEETIGVGQEILLTCGYSSDNPNIMVTWYDGDERLNSLPRSKREYYWEPQNEGVRNIKAVVTDREKVYTCTGQFKVQKCDLAYGIIGDTKEKILRKYPEAKDDGECIDYGTMYSIDKDIWKGQKYYYSNSKIVRIEITGTRWSDGGTTSLVEFHALRARAFIEAYNSLKKIYGEAYSGTSNVPSLSSGSETLKDFAIHNSLDCKFRGPNGKDINLHLLQNTTASKTIIQAIAYV